MNDEKQVKDKEGGVNLGRHQAQCSICLFPYRQQIEEEWINWQSPHYFEQVFKVSRDALYRHAHACDLFSKRQRNIRRALERIIETADYAQTTLSGVVSAINAYTKLNSGEQGVEPVQATDPKKLLERMSQEEREAFAKDGSLPDWFSNGEGAAPGDSQEGEKESEVTETKRAQ